MDIRNSITGLKGQLEESNGSLRATLPQNSSGILLVGEVASAGSAVTETVNFATGLNGIVIDYYSTDTTGLSISDSGTVAFVAFGNTAFNDVTIAGMRWAIPLGGSRTFSFENVSPKPNSITVSIPYDTADAQTALFYAAVQE